MKGALGRALGVASLLVFGIVAGTLSDPADRPPESYRGGYRLLEADFHAHTTWSDGMLSPAALVRQARRRGLDVIGVTEHNGVAAGKAARAYSALTDGPLVIVGEEITSARVHLIGLGLEHTVQPGSAHETIAAVHEQGGVVVAAHPVERFWPALVPVRAELDAVEVMHPIAYRDPGGTFAYGGMRKFADESGLGVRVAAIGSSDYHAFSVLGLCRTWVFVEEPVTSAHVLEALREKRTVVQDREGRLSGSPQLVEALAREPYVGRSSDYAYRGASLFDRAGRFAAWLGVLGLVVLRLTFRGPRGLGPSGEDESRAELPEHRPQRESKRDATRANTGAAALPPDASSRGASIPT